MMIKCPECEKDYSDQAKSCVHCGARNPTKMGGCLKAATIGMALLALFLAFLLFGNLAVNPEKQADRDAIDLCREAEQDQLLDLGARRLARQACDMMERRFTEKYGHNP
jgi:ribosomal protein L40E